MTALESIVAWAEFDLPNWQSDAVRRLLVQAILSDQDRQELLSMLKSLHGLLPSGSPVPQPQPLGKGMVSGAPKSRANIVLKAVKDLQSVNKIPNGSSLPFGHEGLTAIYGENGSGKSGYARVLKRACRARDTQERILPNIYQSSASAAAKATFKLSTDGGPDTEIQWQDGTASDELLTNITVFDSKCARVIINEKNEASYLPYGAHVFEELASLLNWIKGKLEAERPNPQPLQWKEVPATTQVGKILSGITRETPAKDIESAASWNSDDNTKLVQLEKQLADLKANDPAAQAGQVRSFKERVTNLNQQVGRLSSVLSDERLKRLEELVAAQTVAAEAVHLASQETLQNEPLHEAGGSAWQILYSAAKDYSTKDAYPGAEYPVAADGSRCVFCMQLLSDEAKERLRRFSAFMEQSTKKEHGTAKSALDAALIPHDEVRTLASEGLHANVLGEITQRDQATATAVESFLKVLRFRLHFVDKLASGQATEPVQPLPDSPDESLKIIVEELELEAAGYDKAVDPKTRENIEKDVVELKGRKCFTENRQKIIDYLYDLKSAYSFDQAKAATSTASISRKGKKVVSEALTPQLKTAIQTELTNLGVSHLPLMLKPSASKGETLHKLELKGSKAASKVNLSDVLSEGEQRVVALAGFLAEIRSGLHSCPIVLDDPVSSLDHRYRSAIAKRLVEESNKRQVLVFTHDIAFLLELQEKAGELGGTKFSTQTMLQQNEAAGVPNEGLPWHAMPVKGRLQHLRGIRDRIKDLHSSDPAEYAKEAAYFYGLLRETWEAAIEEALLNKTVVRHGNEVQTLRLKQVRVSTEQYKTIDQNMSKCSRWMAGHDKSKKLDVHRPEPNELLADIDVLNTFVKLCTKSGNELRKEREASLTPGTTEVG